MPALKILKSLLSALLLIGVIWLGLSKGQLIQRFDINLFFLNVLVSLAIIFFNACILRWSTLIFDTPLTVNESLLIASSGTLVNAAGGLPIGTIMVFTILVKQHGFMLKQLLLGKIIATLLCIFCLLIILGISRAIESQFSFALIALALGGIGLIGLKIIPSLKKLPSNFRQPYIELLDRHFKSGLFLAAISVSFMLLSYWIVLNHYQPQLPANEAVAITSISLIANYSMMANTLGGLQEIIIGFVSTLYSLTFTDGIDIGLFNRITAIAAAAFTFLLSYLAITLKIKMPAN